MNFGNLNTSAPSGFSFGAPITSTAAQGATSFGSTGGGDAGAAKLPEPAKQPAKLGGFSLGSLPAATSTSTLTTTSTPAPISFGSQPTLKLGATTTTAAATTASTTEAPKPAGAVTSLTSATKTTDSTPATQSSQLNFSQLEEYINKWTLELEEQEKNFTNQATQINAWDKLLIANNDKIVALNDAVQKVKADQTTLEQELEFIATQHAELEESIAPLQKEFMNMPQVDIERTQTYLMVENLDTQLKQMSEDLKEVIDYLNEANKVQDNNDPIVQIGKILNAHMSSLQWIESTSSSVTQQLEEISKMHDSLRRDSERSFRLTYYE
ncbi:unnamed protein product [Hermetia illucens]|uniref:Nucleoporin NSP1-like C-terminal domain-containing protein n=1 Tax=Hermetia illucens TaxID=343691 RepID=A0A7R8YL00_HERIL|nr:nuclear pore glycoprotein p62 isoform X1 [Hermetia illucens]CAD7076968.1 unnamed protein product [Hermetia illucens]